MEFELKSNDGIINTNNSYESKSDRTKEIISTDDYISWLLKFTEKYNEFYIDDWLYKEDEISQKNNDLVNDIQYLFNAISNYCIKNNVGFNLQNSSGAEEYYFKYNGVGFSIGALSLYGGTNYVKRSEITERHVDFEDIKNNVVIGSNENKANELISYFKECVYKLKESDVSCDELKKLINEIYFKS